MGVEGAVKQEVEVEDEALAGSQVNSSQAPQLTRLNAISRPGDMEGTRDMDFHCGAVRYAAAHVTAHNECLLVGCSRGGRLGGRAIADGSARGWLICDFHPFDVATIERWAALWMKSWERPAVAVD